MRLRFPKSSRLNRVSEFARLRREGVSLHGKFMILSVLRGGADMETRFGFVTSRRVGGAVERNRARRRLREIVRADQPGIAANSWIVIVARQSATRADFDQLRNEWRALAQRSGALTPDA